MRWLSSLSAIAVALVAGAADAQTKIDFFFPVPVDGKLAKEMTRLVKVYNDSQKDVAVTAVYTGSYDQTQLKAQAAAGAGKPPAGGAVEGHLRARPQNAGRHRPLQ